ANCKNCGE
ncbi:hypothetical protein CP082626L3_0727B, partial [Chlamydia psittaci 08-2626_L3]